MPYSARCRSWFNFLRFLSEITRSQGVENEARMRNLQAMMALKEERRLVAKHRELRDEYDSLKQELDANGKER